jgi:hypothetical protein
MTGAAPTFQTSPDPAAFTMLASSDWWDKAKNDAESAYHGLRHGVIKMEKATTQWVQKESSDAFHWVVSLAVTIGDDIADVMTIAIDDIKSAIHAVSSFFQALGADIEAGLNWLKHNILALIKEAGQNAKVIEGFLGQLPAKASAQLTAYENLADGYFAALKTQAHAAIQKLASQMETAAFGTSAPIPPPTTDTGSNDAVIAAGDIATFMSHVSHNWLLDKIMSWFEGDSDLAANPAVSAVVKDLITALTDAEDLVKDMTTLVWDGCSVLFAGRRAGARNRADPAAGRAAGTLRHRHQHERRPPGQPDPDVPGHPLQRHQAQRHPPVPAPRHHRDTQRSRRRRRRLVQRAQYCRRCRAGPVGGSRCLCGHVQARRERGTAQLPVLG